MTILLTILLTILAIIVIAVVSVLFLAPLRITIQRSYKSAIDIEFGRYMENVWVGRDWFSITEVYYDEKNEVVNAHFIISIFPGSKEQIAKMNAKIDKQAYEREMNKWIDEDIEEDLREDYLTHGGPPLL